MEIPKKVTPLTLEEFNRLKNIDRPHRFVYPSVKEDIPRQNEDPTLEEVLGAVARQRAKEILAKEVRSQNAA